MENNNELQAAQRRLEEKRKDIPPGPKEPDAVGSMLERYGMLDRLELLKTAPTSGPIRRCEIHHTVLDEKNAFCCEVCEEQRLESHSKKVKAQAEKVEKLLGGIRLGARYQGAKFDDYRPTCEEAVKVLARCRGYASTFPQRLANGDNLLMLGNYGTGKNMLAACICNHVAREGFTAVHTTVLKMLRRIKTTWRKDSKELEQDVIDSFALPDLLVVDEIGVQFGSEAEKILTFEALNGRYEEKRPTILISNLTEMAELQAYLGERVLDRMREGATGVLTFGWESYRGKR